MKHRKLENSQNADQYERLERKHFGNQNTGTGIYSRHPIETPDLAEEGGAGL